MQTLDTTHINIPQCNMVVWTRFITDNGSAVMAITLQRKCISTLLSVLYFLNYFRLFDSHKSLFGHMRLVTTVTRLRKFGVSNDKTHLDYVVNSV